MSTDQNGTTTRGRDTDRLETFSDGVIAIAITLLVLEVRVPHLEEGEGGAELWEQLGHLWPSYLGYLISFVTIGIMWANHHEIFRHIARTNHYLILSNTLFLLCIGFLPFPTALLAEYLGKEGERVAVVVYSGWFLVTALAYNFLWRYPSHARRLIAPDADTSAVDSITRRFRLGPPSYLLAFVLAWIYPPASLALIALLALLYTLPNAAVE